jgi:hypothetical protein
MLVAVVVAAASTGCHRLPATLEMPEVRGRVVDAETKAPIAGAEVFTFLHAESKALLQIGSAKVGAKFTTTNSNGEFEFRAETISVPRKLRTHWRLTSADPTVVALHRDYGWGGRETTEIVDKLSVVIDMKRDPFLLDRRGPSDIMSIFLSNWCGGLSNATYEIRSTVPRPYYRCCDVVFGADASVCRRPGPRREAVLREMEKELD